MDNNKHIGYIIKGDKKIDKSNKKVIFKANNQIYIKKIKEKNKIRRKKYTICESVNIICNDLNDEYVIIDSDNQPYFNKISLILNVLIIFIAVIATGIAMYYEKYILQIFLVDFSLTFLTISHSIYIALGQRKKMYKNYNDTAEGEIINYSRTEYRHNRDDNIHCEYNIMYKYKTPDGTIIHSVVNTYSAELLYKNYPLNKKVLVRYNPLKCCESCLLDEYNSVYNGDKFVKNSSLTFNAIGKITNIITKNIDEEMEDYLKDYCLVDYIECEYTVANKKYKTLSIFSVPHNRFKIGEEIIIFFENEDPNKFLCDINKKYSNMDDINF